MQSRNSRSAYRFVLALLLTVSGSLLGDSSFGASLTLSLNKIIDVSSLNLGGIGGAAFDASTGNVWISDSSGGNRVAEINPVTDAVVSSFNANVIPGLDVGPDSLALHPVTGNLFMFSIFGSETEAGEATQAGAFVREFTSVPDAGGATFNGSNELIISNEGNGELSRVNQVTGALETFVPLVGYVGRVSGLVYDPFTGNFFAYGDATDELLEVNPATGQVLSTTDVSGLLSGFSFPAGIAFNASGDTLYLGHGTDSTGPQDLFVFNRTIPEPSTLVIALLSHLGLGRRRALK